jgi:hypothetical protein
MKKHALLAILVVILLWEDTVTFGTQANVGVVQDNTFPTPPHIRDDDSIPLPTGGAII